MPERKTWIVGSDIGAIMGVNPYRSALDVFLDKTGRSEPTPFNDAMHFGIVLEDVVAKEFERRTGMKVRRNNFMLVSSDVPYFVANIDREIVGKKQGLECKTANAYIAKEWVDDNVPDSYYLQCQHYMAVTGYDSWWIACLIGGQRFQYKEIPRNNAIIEVMIAEGKRFWEDHVLKDVPPEVDGSKACQDALSTLFPKAENDEVMLSDDANGWIDIYYRAKLVEETAKKDKMRAQQELELLLGDCEKGITSNGYVVKWSNVAGRVTFDSKRLKEELPDVYGKYQKQGEDSRRFSIKEAK